MAAPIPDAQAPTVLAVARPLSEAEVQQGQTAALFQQSSWVFVSGTAQAPAPSLPKFVVDHAIGIRAVAAPNAEAAAGQPPPSVWDAIGVELLTNLCNGFHCTVLSYGQQGAGKSFNLVGHSGNKGLVLRCIEELLKIAETPDPDNPVTMRVDLIMADIHMEKVVDLFGGADYDPAGMAIHVHATTGTHVVGLRSLAIPNITSAYQLVGLGLTMRAVNCMQYGQHSARSNLFLRLTLSQTAKSGDVMMSSISFFDLADSERPGEVVSDRMLGSSKVFQSLTCLENVVRVMARNRTLGTADEQPAFESSALTKLLKDALDPMDGHHLYLCGHISPLASDIANTLITMRFVDMFRRLRTRPAQQARAYKSLIRHLKLDIKSLEEKIGKDEATTPFGVALNASLNTSQRILTAPTDVAHVAEGRQLVAERVEEKMQLREEELRAQRLAWKTALAIQERRLTALQVPHDDKLSETEHTISFLGGYLARMGMEHGADMGRRMAKQNTTPFLRSLHPDPLLSGCVSFFLEEGDTTVGRKDSQIWDPPTIILSGTAIDSEHCTFTIAGGKTTVLPEPESLVYVNGVAVDARTQLNSFDIVILGASSFFVYINPAELASIRAANAERREKWQKRQEARQLKGLPVEEMKDDIHDPVAPNWYQMALRACRSDLDKLLTVLLDAEYKTSMTCKAAVVLEADANSKLTEIKNRIMQLTDELETSQRQLTRLRVGASEAPPQSPDQSSRKPRRSKREAAYAVEPEPESPPPVDPKVQIRELDSKVKALTASIGELKEQEKVAITQVQIHADSAAPLKRKSSRLTAFTARVQHRVAAALLAVREANMICMELRRSTDFGLHLWSDPTEQLPSEVWFSVGTAGDDLAPIAEWHTFKFENRFTLLRDFFQLYKHRGREVSILPKDTPEDPLFDEFCHRIIGKCTVFLDALTYMIEVEEAVPIVNNKGVEMGTLVVKMVPFSGEAPPEPGQETQAEDRIELLLGSRMGISVYIKDALGLPQGVFADVYCQFAFLDEDQRRFVTTPQCPFQTSCPRFEFCETFRPMVSEELIDYLRGGSVEIRVFGVDVRNRSPKRPLLRSGTRPTGLAAGSARNLSDGFLAHQEAKQADAAKTEALMAIQEDLANEMQQRQAAETYQAALETFVEDLEKAHAQETATMTSQLRNVETELTAERQRLADLEAQMLALKQHNEELAQKLAEPPPPEPPKSKTCVML